MKSGMTTELGYEELMCAICPLWDAARSVRHAKEKAKGAPRAEAYLDQLEGQIQRALSILSCAVSDIEAENPETFGDGSECDPVWTPS